MDRLRAIAVVPLLGLLLSGAVAHAQNSISVPAVRDSVIDFLVPVIVPPASCAAVSDATGWLALGHRPASGAGAVSLFRLNEQGKPAPTPVALTLPRPAALASHASYPLSLAFHPQLPLLYVWQDFQVEKPNTDLDQPGMKELDHLLIFQIDEPQPKLRHAGCRGTGYGHGNLAGSIALNSAATRLYVPNVRLEGKPPAPAVGYLELDAAGLPVPADSKSDAPAEVRRHTPRAGYFNYPTGLGFHIVSDDRVIVGLGYGPLTWDLDNRRAWGNLVMPSPIVGVGTHNRIAGHPTLPVVYSSITGYSLLCRQEHAEGYLTLAPQRATLEAAVLHSPPVVLARRGQVAVGGVNRVYLLAIDDEGRLLSKRVQATVASAKVEALVYSEKFDRLYVATEKSK